MNEREAGAAPGADLKDSAGALIRAAREKQGLHIAALAVAIKVSPRKLDALENDRWHELPDATFVRALAQTVCRSLKIDPRPVLERLPPAEANSLETVTGTLNTPFQDRQSQGLPGVSAGAIRPMVWAGGLLALAAVVVYFLPAHWLSGGVAGLSKSGLPAAAGSATDTSTDTVLPPLAPLTTVPFAAASAVAAAPAASVAPVVPDSASAATGLPVVAEPQVSSPPTPGETVFSAPPAAMAEPPAGPAPLATSPAGLVQLRATEASWVEARDAGGQLLLSRTVQPGESVGLDGTLPMRLVIGNAEATELGFRGRPVNLAPLTRDNVARVELR